MKMRQFVCDYRHLIEDVINTRLQEPRDTHHSMKEREMWVRNDGPLHSLARAEGVDV